MNLRLHRFPISSMARINQSRQWRNFCLVRLLSRSANTGRTTYPGLFSTTLIRAAIAPGVLIQADPNSQIIIKSGACIGVGTILHAHNDTVEVGGSANIGAEVLLVGQVTIEANTCVGAGSTVYNGTVPWGQVVPPGSFGIRRPMG